MEGTSKEHTVWFKAEGLTKKFGNVVAFENVDIDLYAGEIVGLLGDNGAGKSSFVKVACGVYQPTRGSIRLDGKHVRFNSAYDGRKAGIEAVHQDLGLVDTMSIARNFFCGAELKRGPFLDYRRMERESLRLLTEIGLVNLRDVGQDVSRLSGGERQAISIGRAVAFERQMLILDEPTSALSVKETEKVFQYIRMAKAKGLVVLVIMHNLNQVAAIADRFVVFWHGQKVADFPNTHQSEQELSEYISLGQPGKPGPQGGESKGGAQTFPSA